MASAEDPEDDDDGWKLRINNDDDNNNGIEDRYELGPVENEDDLQAVQVDNFLRDDAYEDDFLATFSASNLRVWTSKDKGEEIITSYRQFKLSELPDEVWVEGIDRGAASLGLTINGIGTTSLFREERREER